MKRTLQVGRTARAGRAGVSVSLAGEAERALVKAIVKRAKRAVKSRQVPPEIVAKYRDRLARLEPDIGMDMTHFLLLFLTS